jgi:hypothetical protein
MNQATPNPSMWQRWVSNWERFWFTPADPTILALIRICCGLITLYTVTTYSFTLQEFMGPDAWLDLETRLDDVRRKPVGANPLTWDFRVFRQAPQTEWEKNYYKTYLEFWGDEPPGEYPSEKKYKLFGKTLDGKDTVIETSEAEQLDNYRRQFGKDLRTFNLPIPKDQKEWDYVYNFSREFNQPPAPPYPRNPNDGAWKEDEEEYVRAYWQKYGYDPRVAYVRGIPVWSIWFHVTDPVWMNVVQGAILLVTLMFVLGFATRITAVLTWFGALSYIHRCPVIVFGVDTMMNILLVYLMLSPCGAALSLDRVLARWWSTARPRVVGRWKALWGRPAGPIYAPPPPPAKPAPSVAANVVIRLLQIHVCIIYLAAGATKLQGRSWWEGTAVWATFSNFEFAPMQYEIYNIALRFLGKNRMVFEIFLTTATYFTLFFEISYAYLVWLRPTRWLMLGMAITLHGAIGIFMGLKTFSLMMLVMNMSFVTADEVHWVLGWFTGKKPASATPPEIEKKTPASSTAIRDQDKAAAIRGS